MENDKGLDFDSAPEGDEGEGELDNAPRARNRTVMLTPEITGQVRARLQREVGGEPDQPAESAPPAESPRSGGFMSVPSRKATAEPTFAPPGRMSTPQPPPQQAPAAPQMRRSAPPPSREEAPPAMQHAPMSAGRPEGDTIEWRKVSPVVAFLVAFDRDVNGEVYPLRVGRLIVTSEVPSGGNFLLLNDESVSSMHAIVRIGEHGDIQVLDQLSEHGTVIRRLSGKEVKLSGEKGELAHGDEIQFGERKFRVCIMAFPDRD